MILSFAFAGLFLVGNNVMGNGGTIGDLDDTITICTETTSEGWYCMDVCRFGGEVGSFCRPKKVKR